MNLLRKKDQNCYVHLMGGLGNQLFQIAAGLHYVYHSGGNLIIDDSFGNFRKNNLGDAAVFSYNSHSFSATGSGSRKKRLTEKGLSLLIRTSLKSRSNPSYKIMVIFLRAMESILISIKFGKRITLWSATNLGFEDIPMSTKSRYLIGYFQTFRFASHKGVENQLKSLSITDTSIDRYKEIAEIEKPLIVHVRLGDYLKESNFGVLSSSYYDKAISLMISNYKFRHIWVFSDEISKAKLLIPERYLKLCRWMDDRDSAAVTLEKMRLGSGYINANSTLSWWGSFLSHTSDAPVVAPHPWFSRMSDPNELIPNNWIKVSR